MNSQPGPAGAIPARDLFIFSQDARKTQQGNAPIIAQHTPASIMLLAPGKLPPRPPANLGSCGNPLHDVPQVTLGERDGFCLQ